MRFGHPLDFHAVYDIPVDVAVLLVFGEPNRREYLNVLASIARKLRSEDVLRAMRTPGRLRGCTRRLFGRMACEIMVQPTHEPPAIMIAASPIRSVIRLHVSVARHRSYSQTGRCRDAFAAWLIRECPTWHRSSICEHAFWYEGALL